MNATEISNQRRGIMSGCEYILKSIHNIKKRLIVHKPNESENIWAIGGIIITLTASLVSITQTVILDAAKKNEPDVFEDLKDIQKQFNEIIDKMLENTIPTL